MCYLDFDAIMIDIMTMSEVAFREKHSMNDEAYDFATDVVDSFSLSTMWEEDILTAAYKEIFDARGGEFATTYLSELWITDLLNTVKKFSLISADVRHEKREYVVNYETGFMRRIK